MDFLAEASISKIGLDVQALIGGESYRKPTKVELRPVSMAAPEEVVTLSLTAGSNELVLPGELRARKLRMYFTESDNSDPDLPLGVSR